MTEHSKFIQHAKHWNLKHDSQLRAYLQEGTNKLLTSINRLEKLGCELSDEAELLSVRLENIHGRIHNLKNERFMEEKVEEYKLASPDSDADKIPRYPQDSSNNEAWTTQAITDAVKMGFEFIDGEKIKPFPLSKHEEKDEYPPMPVVIGSWEFYSLVKNTSNLPKSDIQQNETINNHMNTRNEAQGDIPPPPPLMQPPTTSARDSGDMFIPHDPVSSASLKNLVLLQSDDQQSDISSDRVRGPARRLPSKSGHECNKSFSDADAPLSTVDSISSKVVDLYPTNSNATSIPNPQQRKSQSFQPSHNSVKRPSPAERKGIFSAVDSPPSDAFFAKSTAAGIASSNRQNPLQSTDKKNDVPKADESKPSASKPKFKANKSIFESSSSSEDEFILPPLIPSKKSSPTFLTSKTVAKTPTTKTAPPVVKPTPAAVPAASTNKFPSQPEKTKKKSLFDDSDSDF